MYHVQVRACDKPIDISSNVESVTIFFGPDWWLEEYSLSGKSVSYEIIEQGPDFQTVVRRPTDWVKDIYLGKRIVDMVVNNNQYLRIDGKWYRRTISALVEESSPASNSSKKICDKMDLNEGCLIRLPPPVKAVRSRGSDQSIQSGNQSNHMPSNQSNQSNHRQKHPSHLRVLRQKDLLQVSIPLTNLPRQQHPKRLKSQ